MILYGSSMSPFVRKVLAYAHEKGIELEPRPVGIGDQTPEFRAASPFGKMPALVDGDFGLADSSAIIQYLEARFPEPVLIPAEPQARGRVIWFEEFGDTMLATCGGKMFFNRVVAPIFMRRGGDEQVAAAAERNELPPLLDYLEGVVPQGDGYLVGDSLTLADLAVASPLANLGHMDVAIDPARHPKTAAYAERILARPSFQVSLGKERRALEKLRAA
jgi:glutathione S-transferase